MTPEIAIFARWPEPGKAKTRLIPALGAEGAAKLYARLLELTVHEARASGLPFHLRITGDDPARFRDWLGDDLDVRDQGDGDLGEKLARVPTPGLMIGSDCPGLTAALLRETADALATHAAVIGPADDGGYWLLGLRDPCRNLFTDMAWSTPQVYPETRRRLDALGITPYLLPELTDIDTGDDLEAWPELLA
ncbi:TIGR04282 family arsenosugar biosynthesis glycosyltransferase [Citromicrobium bathyomarinum]|uniref:TIGR04282 family arsenosugar biosynthesis glycosyltransferase n=1 Tax=Citromicrobium bathyomarinum TaxID=72174 RepID=UPI00315A68CD